MTHMQKIKFRKQNKHSEIKMFEGGTKNPIDGLQGKPNKFIQKFILKQWKIEKNGKKIRKSVGGVSI